MSQQILTVSIRISPHDALNEASYGSTHGFGERVLPLEVKSRTPRFFIELPVICRCKDNKLTPLFEKVTNPTWETLFENVGEECIIKVTLNDGTRSHNARLSLPGSEPFENKTIGVRLQEQEYEEAMHVLKKGHGLVKEKLK